MRGKTSCDLSILSWYAYFVYTVIHYVSFFVQQSSNNDIKTIDQMQKTLSKTVKLLFYR